MLSQYSWSDFFLFLAVLLSGYGIYLIVFWFREEASDFISGKFRAKKPVSISSGSSIKGVNVLGGVSDPIVFAGEPKETASHAPFMPPVAKEQKEAQKDSNPTPGLKEDNIENEDKSFASTNEQALDGVKSGKEDVVLERERQGQDSEESNSSDEEEDEEDKDDYRSIDSVDFITLITEGIGKFPLSKQIEIKANPVYSEYLEKTAGNEVSSSQDELTQNVNLENAQISAIEQGYNSSRQEEEQEEDNAMHLYKSNL